MLIGFAGKKQTGKSTSSDYLIDKYNFVNLSFAGPLKQICKELFFLNEEEVNGSLKETINSMWQVTPRYLMQVTGSELFRDTFAEFMPHIGKDIWSIHIERRIKDLKGKNIVITDVRFQNEIDLINKLGGIVIYIDRKTEYQDNHQSENSELKVDMTIENNSTLDSLYQKLDILVENILY